MTIYIFIYIPNLATIVGLCRHFDWAVSVLHMAGTAENHNSSGWCMAFERGEDAKPSFNIFRNILMVL